MIQKFQDLIAWKESHKLATETYLATKKFPKDEIFGITNQMRRSAVSIPSNIAEGFCRQSLKEQYQFFSISLGSNAELQSQLEISKDVGYLSAEDYLKLTLQSNLVHKLIFGLIKHCRATLH